MPVILIILDDYLSFQEKTEGKYEDMIARLSREGAANNIFLVVTSAGIKMGDFLSES